MIALLSAGNTPQIGQPQLVSHNPNPIPQAGQTQNGSPAQASSYNHLQQLGSKSNNFSLATSTNATPNSGNLSVPQTNPNMLRHSGPAAMQSNPYGQAGQGNPYMQQQQQPASNPYISSNKPPTSNAVFQQQGAGGSQQQHHQQGNMFHQSPQIVSSQITTNQGYYQGGGYTHQQPVYRAQQPQGAVQPGFSSYQQQPSYQQPYQHPQQQQVFHHHPQARQQQQMFSPAVYPQQQNHQMMGAQAQSSWTINYNEIQLGKELGRGAFGIVYRGRWRFTDVAVKVCQGTPSPQDLKTFRDETQLMMSLRPHRNVVQLRGVCDNPVCVVIDFVEGGSLEGRLNDKTKAVGWKQIFQWTQGIVAGMLHLHLEGIIHRDLAARNILLDGMDNALISDFGLSTQTWSSSNVKQETGFFRGPYKWMAPESLSMNQFSAKSDVWSFGVTLWEILSRRQPFEDKTIYQVKEEVLRHKLRLPLFPKWPEMFRNLLVSCWRTDPQLRPDFNTIASWVENMYKEFEKDPANFNKEDPSLSLCDMPHAKVPAVQQPQSSSQGHLVQQQHQQHLIPSQSPSQGQIHVQSHSSVAAATLICHLHKSLECLQGPSLPILLLFLTNFRQSLPILPLLNRELRLLFQGRQI